jgi:hypothetical protein
VLLAVFWNPLLLFVLAVCWWGSQWLECCFHARFLLGLFFDPEDGDYMSLRNVRWLLTDYTALYPRRSYDIDRSNKSKLILLVGWQDRLAYMYLLLAIFRIAFSTLQIWTSFAVSLHTNFSYLFMPVNDTSVIRLELCPILSRHPAVVCIIENLERNYMFMVYIRLNLLQTS